MVTLLGGRESAGAPLYIYRITPSDDGARLVAANLEPWERTRLKPFVVFAAAALIGLSACTELGYVKPGVSDEEFAQDSEDCAEIARHQAFRDISVFDTRVRHDRFLHHGRRSSSLRGFQPSLSELEFRYRRLCMTARGYELAPLDGEETREGS